MAFVKRRKQPHLFRDPSIDPTKQVRAQLTAAAAVVATDPAPKKKKAAKRSKRAK